MTRATISQPNSGGIGRLLVRSLATALLVCLQVAVGLAADQSPDYGERFLAKLRERGWHDVALEYLERAGDDPLVSPAFLQRVGYESAATRVDLARQAAGRQERKSLLSAAAKGFEQYAQQHPNSPLELSALSQLANLLADQALTSLQEAEQLPEGAEAQAEKLRTAARELIDEAREQAERVLEAIPARLAGLPKGTAVLANPESLELRQDLESQQAEASFLLANLRYERARTFASKSNEWSEALEEAAEDFAKLQQEYENKLVGFYAQLYEGRCYQTQGDYRKALEVYERLISQPVGQAEFRKLVTRAYRQRVECHLALNNPKQAIEEASRWWDQSQETEQREPEWLALAYRLGETYQVHAEKESSTGEASHLRTEARKLFREVSRVPGEFQQQARTALALSGNGDSAPVEVKAFADALAAGKDALDRAKSTQLAARLAANNNPDAVEDLERQASENRAAAEQYFQSAVKLVDENTPAEEAAAAHYYLCWLSWEAGHTEASAELGRQIAERYADTPYASTAAKITLAAYERLYLAAQSAGRANEEALMGQKLRDIAQTIVDRWGDSEAAVTATNLLISLALSENHPEEADRLLAQLPPDSQAAAGLTLGAALWSRYLQSAGSQSPTPVTELAALKSRAAKLLDDGYQALSGQGKINTTQAAAVLYHAQSLLDQGQTGQAVEVLEDPAVGPLAQLKQPDVSHAFAVETCKTALQAYLSLDPPPSEEVTAILGRLEKLSGTSEKAQEQLTRIYVSLGLKLQRQIEALTDSGEAAQARSLSAAFAELLNRVAEQGDSQRWEVRAWLAETSLQLGAGLQGDERRRYLQQAETAYRELLTEVEKNPSFAPSENAVWALRKKLGECQMARGDYAEAVKQFAAILAKQPNLLVMQQATAEAFEKWGIAKQDPALLEQAIRGSHPQADGRNLVWGWLRISDLARNGFSDNPKDPRTAKYRDLFFEARYHAARARLEAARLASGNDRTQQTGGVIKSIDSLKQLYPDLGGEKWKAAFDALLKEAQQ